MKAFHQNQKTKWWRVNCRFNREIKTITHVVLICAVIVVQKFCARRTAKGRRFIGIFLGRFFWEKEELEARVLSMIWFILMLDSDDHIVWNEYRGIFPFEVCYLSKITEKNMCLSMCVYLSLWWIGCSVKVTQIK